MPKADIASKRITIIEDDKDINELLAYNLRREGFLVEQAFNGEDGLNTTEQKLPDLIILDLMLPNIDGYEVLRVLKENKELRDIPVIILSAKVSSGAIIKGFNLGAADYIPKPFAVGELVFKIKAILGGGRQYLHAE